MLGKMWSVAVAAVVVGALALPAPAAYAQTSTAPAAKPAATKKPMVHKSAHRMDCYDYAYQSQAMQDCLAKKGNKTGSSKPVKKVSKKKTTS